MKEMKFEFEYNAIFHELDVKTEQISVVITKGQADNIRIKGEIIMSPESGYYGITDDKFVEFNASENRLAIDTEDFESDLEDRGIDLSNSKILILIPDGLKVNVESELGKIKFEQINADAQINSEVGSITLDDISGNFKVDSEIGSVRLKKGDFQSFFCSTEVGNVEITSIKADYLMCETEVGQIIIKEAEVSNVTLSSETGNIEYQLLPIKQNQTKIDAEIGKVKIIIPQEINLELRATSEMGSVNTSLKNVIFSKIEDGVILKTDVDNQEAGKATFDISTEIGSITLLNSDNQEAEAKQHFKSSKLNNEINRAMSEMNKVTKVLGSPALRKSIGGAFANLGDVIKSSVQTALKEADITVKESMKDMKADLQQQRQDIKSENVRNWQEAQYRSANSARGKANTSRYEFWGDERLSDNEQSRLKILNLLEQGKITHAEAELLLKAIN